MRISHTQHIHHIRHMLTTIFAIGLICLTSLGFSPISEISPAAGQSMPDSWTSGDPTGSASYLNGSTVFVSFFVEDPHSSWSDEERALVMSKLDIATDYLISAGASYGKTVSLTYDIYDHPDLAYTISYPKNIRDNNDSARDLLDYMVDYIAETIPTTDLLNEYQATSIGYLCFLNKDGVSYTFPYYDDDSDCYLYETCFLYLKCDDEYEPPAVYAHEILHLFGARDLYETNETDGISKEFVQYIETNYPNEIMLTTYDENWNNVQDHVTNDLTDITAYFIGWLDTIPELSTYPSIETEYPACFTEVDHPSGNYEDYSAGDDTDGLDWGSSSNSGTLGNSDTPNTDWSANGGNGNGNGYSSSSDDTIWWLILRLLWEMFGW